MAIDKRLFNVTKNVTAYRGKRQHWKNYQEKRGTLGFRGNSKSDANCKEKDFVVIDCGVRRVKKKQTESHGNRLNLSDSLDVSKNILEHSTNTIILVS